MAVGLISWGKGEYSNGQLKQTLLRVVFNWYYIKNNGLIGGIDMSSTNTVLLTPLALRTEIDKYKGTFVVMLETCYAGMFISNTTNFDNVELSYNEIETIDNEIEDFLNGFIGQLVGGEFDSSTDNSIMATGNSNLAGTNRIKVFGACRYDEQSFRGDENATKEWCLGAGYDSSFNPYDEEESPDPLKADYNSDNRISLYELYYYSYNEVLKRVYQHIVHYPSGDQYIIYEDHF